MMAWSAARASSLVRRSEAQWGSVAGQALETRALLVAPGDWMITGLASPLARMSRATTASPFLSLLRSTFSNAMSILVRIFSVSGFFPDSTSA